jgi:hypothetical protein
MYWFPIIMSQEMSDFMGILGLLIALPTIFLMKKYHKTKK